MTDKIIEILIPGIILIIGVVMIIYFSFFSIKHKKLIDESLEYLSKKRHRKPAYEPNERVYKRFQDDFTELSSLSAMAKDIMRHLGLPNSSIPVYPVDEIEGTVAGRFVSDRTGTYIQVRILQDTRPNEVLAVLIHEVMHYYLRTSRIEFEETIKNEILTDTSTIYFGFGEFIDRGYVRVGYIKYPEISYIKRKLKK